MVDRRTFSTMLTAGAGISSFFGWSGKAQAQPAVGARDVVLVHGAYADGSCWSEVIGRLQTAGLTATAVQNPLTSWRTMSRLPDAFWGCRTDRPCSSATPERERSSARPGLNPKLPPSSSACHR